MAYGEIAQIAGSLTVTAGLIIVLIIISRGDYLTRRHHDDVVRVKDEQLTAARKAEDRAWEEVESARKELAANNMVMERLVNSVGEQTRTVADFGRVIDVLRSTIEALRARR